MIARPTTSPETLLIDGREAARLEKIRGVARKRRAIRRAQERSGAFLSIQEKGSTPVFARKVKKPRYLSTCQAPRVVDELDAKTTRKTHIAVSSASQSAAFDLNDLARIVAAWPSLPEPIRRAMMALIG